MSKCTFYDKKETDNSEPGSAMQLQAHRHTCPFPIPKDAQEEEAPIKEDDMTTKLTESVDEHHTHLPAIIWLKTPPL